VRRKKPSPDVCKTVREKLALPQGANLVPATEILVGIGANLPSARFGSPRQTVEAALLALAAGGIDIVQRSRWYETAPVPASDQPNYVNGAALVASSLAADALLALLHRIEADFGRVRSVPNAARVLDLDLLAYGELVIERPGGLILPHPRLAERGFVLLPMADLVPDWHHPVSGLTLPQMIAQLPPGQDVRRLD
jgi:2-amino-4-hydroxy-6-hydroxymethyldihydropteridine diphosphokinase